MSTHKIDHVVDPEVCSALITKSAGLLMAQDRFTALMIVQSMISNLQELETQLNKD